MVNSIYIVLFQPPNLNFRALHEDLDGVLKDMQSRKIAYSCVYFNVKLSSYLLNNLSIKIKPNQGPSCTIQESNQVLLEIQAKITSSVKALKVPFPPPLPPNLP